MIAVRSIDRASKALAATAGVALVLMLLLTVLNIVLRLAGMPLNGTFELVGLIAAVVTGLTLADAQRAKSHIAIDLLMVRAPMRFQLWTAVLMTVVAVVMFVVLAWQLVVYGLNLQAEGAATASLQLEIWPTPLILAVGVGVLALALVADLFSLGRNLRMADPVGIW